MSVVDIHPEELLDKRAQGLLSASESQLLETHLARCAVCRFELSLREDLSVDVAALEVAAPPQLLHSMPVAARRTPGRVRRWSLASMAATAVFVLAAGAFASIAVPRIWPFLQRVVAPGGAGTTNLPQVGKPAKSPGHAAAPASVSVPSSASVSPTPRDVSPLVPMPAPVSRAKAPRAAGSPSSASSAEFQSATALFAAANHARRSGDVRAAKELYAALQSRFPHSSEASISRVTLGMLLLNGDPASALANFDAYLASGTQPLAAEALVGRARANRALGRRAEARRAWQEVEARFPSSVYAVEAREMIKAANAP